jgi:hypothetical protein
MSGTHPESPGAVDDPFFREVRRRHPDVDIVLLPPSDGEQAAADAPVVGDDVVAAARRRVEDTARRLWAVVAPGSEEEPRERLGFGAHEGWLRSSARVADQRDDGPAALDRLDDVLRERGADVRREPGALPRLHGVLGDLTVTASAAATGAVLLAVESAPLHVGERRAPELVRGAR